MSKFVPLKVKEIIRETPGAVTICFETPSDQSFEYLAGQYLTLKLNVDGKEERRAYSLCSAPGQDDFLAVTVKRVDQGKVSNFVADELKAGDTVEVFPPMGKFLLSPDEKKSVHYILIAGGSGITPMMSILRTVLVKEPNSRVTLLYGNRDEESIIFKAKLDKLEQENPDRLRVVHVLQSAPSDWSGLTGLMDRHVVLQLVQDLLNQSPSKKGYFLCGPAAMMDEVVSALGFLGVPKSDIHRELFTAPLPDLDKMSQGDSAQKRADYDVTILLDGKEYNVLVKADENILAAAIDAGLDPPYACTMGVCCTCRAKVLSGKVDMDEDEGLSDSEMEDGFVLTCQSHPMTSGVKVEYS